MSDRPDKTEKQELRARCTVFGKCGGCALLNMSYDRQLSYKMGMCIRLLGRFGRVDEMIGMDDPFHYRCKVQAAFTRTSRGQIISGIYKSSSHTVVKTDSCLLEDEKADEIIVFIRSLISSFGLGVYDECEGRGFLRHVLVRKARATGEYLVVLVTGTNVFPNKKDFISELTSCFPEIKSVVQNVNSGFTSMVLGDRDIVLYGRGYVTDVMLGRSFRISAASFYQVNPVQTEKLYSLAMDRAGLTGKEVCVDAYCGVGTIGLIAAKNARSVIGFESNEQAVRDARENARINNADNIRFVCADATEALAAMAADGEKADVVFMDPPRAGSTKKFIDSVARLAPARVVYISCNPETLARDLQVFRNDGYKVKNITPVDMFPWTKHVETVVLITRSE